MKGGEEMIEKIIEKIGNRRNGGIEVIERIELDRLLMKDEEDMEGNRNEVISIDVDIEKEMIDEEMDLIKRKKKGWINMEEIIVDDLMKLLRKRRRKMNEKVGVRKIEMDLIDKMNGEKGKIRIEDEIIREVRGENGD